MPDFVDGKLVPSDDSSVSSTKKTMSVDGGGENSNKLDTRVDDIVNKETPTKHEPLGKVNVGDNEPKEKHPPANDSSLGTSNPETLQYSVRTNHPAAMTRIEKVLKDGGMDSMSTIRSLQGISEILEQEIYGPSDKRIK
jgi:hypothetical protein